MSLSGSLESNILFRAELRGRTLIISPTGDALGFRMQDERRERETLLQAIDSGDADSLLIDLSGSRYFGSTVIGDLVALTIRAREQGLATAICELSPDMFDVLDRMQLLSMWQVYDTRSAAVRDTVREPLVRRLRRFAPWVVTAALVLVAVFGIREILSEAERLEQRNQLHMLSRAYSEFREMRARGITDSDRQIYLGRWRPEIKALHADLKGIANSERVGHQQMLFAVRDYFEPMVTGTGSESKNAEREFLRCLKVARLFWSTGSAHDVMAIADGNGGERPTSVPPPEHESSDTGSLEPPEQISNVGKRGTIHE